MCFFENLFDLWLRQKPLSSMDFYVRQRIAGKLISKLFGIPSFGVECCKMDYLHAVDLGVAADFMDSLFYYVTMKKLLARPREQVCCTLQGNTSLLQYKQHPVSATQIGAYNAQSRSARQTEEPQTSCKSRGSKGPHPWPASHCQEVLGYGFYSGVHHGSSKRATQQLVRMPVSQAVVHSAFCRGSPEVPRSRSTF